MPAADVDGADGAATKADCAAPQTEGAYSGLVVRIAGDDAIGADQFLPNMAGEEFVSCLTCTALEGVAETAPVFRAAAS